MNVPLEMIEKGEYTGLDDKDELIFVYCRTGIRSRKAAAILAADGYTNVVDIGGINKWKGDVE